MKSSLWVLVGSASRYLFSALVSPDLTFGQRIASPGSPSLLLPEGRRAGGEARRGVALPGWSPAPPPAAPLPSNGSGRAAPGNLPATKPKRGRSPGLSLFLGLQTPPRHSGRHLEPRRASRSCSCTREALRLRAPGPHRPALLQLTNATVHPYPRLSGPTEFRRGTSRYAGPGQPMGAPR